MAKKRCKKALRKDIAKRAFKTTVQKDSVRTRCVEMLHGDVAMDLHKKYVRRPHAKTLFATFVCSYTRKAWAKVAWPRLVRRARSKDLR